MRSRLELDDILRHIPGVKKVYFQPPSNVKMQYPCIAYKRDGSFDEEADDLKYIHKPRYSLTVIDPNPDSKIADYILTHFSLCRAERNFVSNNLHHSIIILYY